MTYKNSGLRSFFGGRGCFLNQTVTYSFFHSTFFLYRRLLFFFERYKCFFIFFCIFTTSPNFFSTAKNCSMLTQNQNDSPLGPCSAKLTSISLQFRRFGSPTSKMSLSLHQCTLTPNMSTTHNINVIIPTMSTPTISIL